MLLFEGKRRVEYIARSVPESRGKNLPLLGNNWKARHTNLGTNIFGFENGGYKEEKQ